MQLNAGSLLERYRLGQFPMSNDRNGIDWHDPDPRSIIPIESYKTQKSLKSTINRGLYEVKVNAQFETVLRACAELRTPWDGTWMNDEMFKAYIELHEMGHAHSVEIYEDEVIIGGLYGVHIGGVFFGESMFSKKTNASKLAFHHLLKILKDRQFSLLDSQYINPHTRMLGAIEIPRSEFKMRLKHAIVAPASFTLLPQK